MKTYNQDISRRNTFLDIVTDIESDLSCIGGNHTRMHARYIEHEMIHG